MVINKKNDTIIDHLHSFQESDKLGYEICMECGSYHSIAQIDPKIIYEYNPYWGEGTGRSSLQEQVQNFTCIDDCGISKVDRLLQFVPKGQRVLEIGCAPGILLRKLMERGYEAYGIEPSVNYMEFICNQAPGAKIINGYFPSITKDFPEECFDCIISSDVMEHCDDTFSFFSEGYRLLKKRGTMITMSPIILADGLYRKIDFDHPDQHCWIYTQKFLEPYLKGIFRSVEFRRWLVGHEILICKK